MKPAPDNHDDARERPHSRREFFRSLGRSAALAGLTAAAAVLVLRGGSQECVNRGICGGCRVYADCPLPAALSRKAAEG